MKAFYLILALAVVVASVVAVEEEDDFELFEMLEKRSPEEGDLLEEMAYGSEPMVKRGRFKYCQNKHGDNCVCDRKYRRNNRRRYVNCVPANMGTPV